MRMWIATKDGPRQSGLIRRPFGPTDSYFVSGKIALDPVTTRWSPAMWLSDGSCAQESFCILKAAGTSLEKVGARHRVSQEHGDFAAMNKSMGATSPLRRPLVRPWKLLGCRKMFWLRLM